MVRIANEAATGPTREYRSELRAEQAEATRTRILDATLRVMAGGVATVSIPAVAREAGVSVPTVYRHFGTKSGLLKALYRHLMPRIGMYDIAPLTSIGEFRTAIRAIFDRLDAADDLARVAIASPAAAEARRATMPDRLRFSRQFVGAIAPDLATTDQDRIARIVVVLTMSTALRTWRDHLGATADAAADDVEWTIRSLIDATSGGTVR
jgi:AcrR family transcriptional regulator